MYPFHPQWRAMEPAQRREAQRFVSAAKIFLAADKLQPCWQLIVQALSVDGGAPGLDVLVVCATALRALRAPQRPGLPSGDPEPYAVFGLDPAVPNSRNPAVIQSIYRYASDLLHRSDPSDPCSRAFTEATHLVEAAWAFLSDPDSKASLDSRFEAAATAAAPVPTAPQPPPPQPALPPPPQRLETGRYVRTAKDLLAAGKLEDCWRLLIQAISADQFVPGADVLLVAATALRAKRRRLPSGAPEPYGVFGLDHAVPTSRDPAVIGSCYRHAWNLLSHCHPNDPCWPAFTEATSLITDAWAVLSDPALKASLDSSFEAAAAAASGSAALLLQPQAGLVEMCRSKRKRSGTSASAALLPQPQAGLVERRQSNRTKKPLKKMNL